mmetsp:Transcript_25625/g.73672  ORF Transcript_25625/g.73672 Transcript_25625/m.73672 type:complete len:201 (-) Transcript_25625:7-609(-)
MILQAVHDATGTSLILPDKFHVVQLFRNLALLRGFFQIVAHQIAVCAPFDVLLYVRLRVRFEEQFDDHLRLELCIPGFPSLSKATSSSFFAIGEASLQVFWKRQVFHPEAVVQNVAALEQCSLLHLVLHESISVYRCIRVNRQLVGVEILLTLGRGQVQEEGHEWRRHKDASHGHEGWMEDLGFGRTIASGSKSNVLQRP